MKKWLSIVTAASLLLYPFAAFSIDYGSQPSKTQQAPPVAQKLVREGDFAIKLAAELDLGTPTDEAVAEDMLVKAGVAPLNGWISDYPMTPEIIGQLQDAITDAAGEGKLPMTAEEGTKGLYSLATRMNLPTAAGPGTPATEGPTAPADQSAPPANPTVINNYYYDEGPPVITYYAPPADYLYLYAWVPYPFWWFGFWFPGFFICHNFATTVFVDRTVFVNGRPSIVSRTAVVSNHVIDPVTRTAATVDPVVRTGTGGVRPVSTLRTANGSTFRNVTELRTAVNTGRAGTYAKSGLAAGGFRSPEARKSAGVIYSRSVARTGAYRTGGSGAIRGERRFNAPGRPGRSFNTGPVRGGNRPYVSPRSYERSYRSSPMMRYGNQSYRSYAAPRAAERSWSAPVRGGGWRPAPSLPSRSFGGSGGRSFPGGGWRGR